MLRFFKKDTKITNRLCTVDIHSHLIPGIDDGAKTMEDSIALIREFEQMGYTKLITTPHIMYDFYDNKEEDIRVNLQKLRNSCQEAGLNIELDVAAEYYLDEHLYKRMSTENEDFLTFGDNFLLFETPFLSEPLYLKEFIFITKSKGFKPVLAHPERYTYIQSNTSIIDDLKDRGVLLQLNINSLSGYYSKQVKKMAEELVKQKKIDFIGSDCHNINHLNATKASRRSKYYNKALNLPLLNFDL